MKSGMKSVHQIDSGIPISIAEGDGSFQTTTRDSEPWLEMVATCFPSPEMYDCATRKEAEKR